ncbi:MAG: ATP12 family chaperone protein [Roseinatronobacter sp.]
MSGWVKKRFWTDAHVAEMDGGFTVTLDGRGIKTPAKAALILPTRALAELIAQEWRDQPEKIDPGLMPATRAANAAIDKVTGQRGEVAKLVTAYGDSDLVCYRATKPEALIAREAAAWDPLLDWTAHRYGYRPVAQNGVVHVAQPAALLASLEADVARFDAFALTALHDLVALSGSLLIGLAVTDRFDTPEKLWQASRVDEDWQIEQWGEDDDATALAEGRKRGFMDAARFYFALKG